MNFSKINNLPNRRKLLSILVTEYAFVSHQAKTVKTDLLHITLKLVQLAPFIFTCIYRFRN